MPEVDYREETVENAKKLNCGLTDEEIKELETENNGFLAIEEEINNEFEGTGLHASDCIKLHHELKKPYTEIHAVNKDFLKILKESKISVEGEEYIDLNKAQRIVNKNYALSDDEWMICTYYLNALENRGDSY